MVGLRDVTSDVGGGGGQRISDNALTQFIAISNTIVGSSHVAVALAGIVFVVARRLRDGNAGGGIDSDGAFKDAGAWR